MPLFKRKTLRFFMKKITTFLIILSLFTIKTSAQQEEIKLIARIKAQGKEIKIARGKETSRVNIKLSHQKLLQTIKDLKPGDEALMTGHFEYLMKGVEEKSSSPIFVIDSIKPISLKRLGEMNQKINEKTLEEEKVVVFKSEAPFEPKSLPVTGPVASAITMTMGLLMLQELSVSENEPKARKDLNAGLIFSAGALATGVFIYEQIRGKEKVK